MTMTMRFWFAVGVCAGMMPWLVPVVQATVESTLAAHGLGWLNPGNSTGMVLGYAAGWGMVSVVASGCRRVTRIGVRDLLWWLGAISLVCALFVGVREGLSFWLGAEYGLLAAVSLSGLGLMQVTRQKFPEYRFDPHVKGARIASAGEIRRRRGPLPPGLVPWGADYIDYTDETQHFMLLGNIGGGKTTYLRAMMSWLAWREQELWILFDPKIELVPHLEALGKRVMILNPLDRRRVAWDMAADIVNEPLILTVVKAFIPDGEGQEVYWSQSAQNLLSSVMGFFVHSGQWWDLRDVFLACSNLEVLKAILGEDKLNAIIAQSIEGDNSKGGANDYLSTLNHRLRPFWVMAALWHSAREKVSLGALIQSEDFENTVIVLGNDNTSGATVQILNSILFERLVNHILDLPDSKERRIWLWIDEVSEASKFVGHNLVRFMTLARSRGGCAVLSAQNTAGMEDKFGERAARQLLELSRRLAVVGGVDGETARAVSEVYLGEVEVVEAQIGYSEEYDGTERELGEGFKRGGEKEVSPTFRRVKRALVPKEELFSSAIADTGPTHGLTGFFSGSAGGAHWQTYPWKAVQAMQVEVETDVLAYDRIGEREPGLRLQPWSDQELAKWGLSDDVEESEAIENSLFTKFKGEAQLSRADALRLLCCGEEDLDQLTQACGLGTGVGQFSRSAFTRMLAKISEWEMGLKLDWE
jgi:hypothetical protein